MTRLAPLWFAAVACQAVTPEVDWQQMIDQHKLQPYEASDHFADGRAMQPPPLGTVPRTRIVGRPELTEGVVRGAYVQTIPIAVTRRVLELGRDRFDTLCAACHGLDGSGDSAVARHMEQRRPPPLVTDPVLGEPPGRIYQVIARGYGLMPSYAAHLSPEERWAVVAYLRALQLSRSVRLAELPHAEQQSALTALGAAR